MDVSELLWRVGDQKMKGWSYFIQFFMERTIKQLQDLPSWKESMRKCCRSNKLVIDIVAYFTPLKFRAAYSKFAAIYEKKSGYKIQRWIQNELKAFYWICVAVSCIAEMRIADFGEKQKQIINEIFYFKQPLTLEYEANKLVEEANKKQSWAEEEDKILFEIVNQSADHNKWNEFARRLYEVSEKKFYRTGKQCRERWLNHLDPSKKHGEWTQEQDMAIVSLLISEGKRWSKIAKKTGDTRTEHQIKNRFKTIMFRQKKEYPTIRNENILLKAYLDPSVAAKYLKREKPQNNQEIKVQQKVEEPEDSKRLNEEGLIQEEDSQEPNQGEQDKHVPHTTCTFDLPQVYSPWYVNIPLTPISPTVPYFVNITSFSTFDANFSSQFYCARQSSDKSDHN